MGVAKERKKIIMWFDVSRLSITREDRLRTLARELAMERLSLARPKQNDSLTLG